MPTSSSSPSPSAPRRRRAVRIGLGALLVLVGLVASGVRRDLPVETLQRTYAPPPSRFVELEGMRVHYRDEGSGPPLLLVHGTSASLHTWDGWVRELATHRRILRLDLPGFGLTGPAPDADYRAERYARLLAAFLGHLGLEQVDVAGNSLGGRVALTFALEHPERVRKLVLIDATGLSGHVPPPIFRLARTPVLNQLMLHVTPRFMIARNLHDVYGEPERVTEALIDRYHALLLREGNRRALVDRLSGPADADLDARLGEIRAPTLIQWGARDRWVPIGFAHRLARGIEGSVLRIHADAGHVPMEELPEVTAAEVDAFLGAVGAAD